MSLPYPPTRHQAIGAERGRKILILGLRYSHLRPAACMLEIGFEPGSGRTKGVTQAANHEAAALVGQRIVAVLSLQPRQVGKPASGMLARAVPKVDRGAALVAPDMPAELGGRLL